MRLSFAIFTMLALSFGPVFAADKAPATLLADQLFINDDTTHGILRMPEMFLNTKTGEWHRVFDLGAEIPESQVPEQCREYDATIFVAGAIEL